MRLLESAQWAPQVSDLALPLAQKTKRGRGTPVVCFVTDGHDAIVERRAGSDHPKNLGFPPCCRVRIVAGVVTTRTLERSREAIGRLSRAGLDWWTFAGEAIPHLDRAIGFDCWCLALTDPDTHLPAGGSADNPVIATQQRRLWELEFKVPDANTHRDLVRGPQHVGVLSAAVGGDLSRSARWSELLRPGGLGDELRAALVGDARPWGDLCVYRERGSAPFSPDQARWVSEILADLSLAARGSWAIAGSRISEDGEGPGTQWVAADGTLITQTATARRWLAHLGPQATAVQQALVAMVGADTGRPARVRMRSVQGHWFELNAERLDGPAGHVAVTIQPASPQQIAPLLMSAIGFSRRERDIAALVLEGLSTQDITSRLFVSPHTIQDHLKSIFEKTGVRSRRQLTARLTGKI